MTTGKTIYLGATLLGIHGCCYTPSNSELSGYQYLDWPWDNRFHVVAYLREHRTDLLTCQPAQQFHQLYLVLMVHTKTGIHRD